MGQNNREKFSSRLGFLLVSAGCAIGLGNVYRFPIWAGAYGGAIFVVIYLAFLVLLGLPVMCAELAVGRGSKRSIASSFDVLEKKGQKWHIVKYLGIAGNYLLMMFYTTITGWFCTYFIKYLSGSMTASSDTLNEFVGMISSPLTCILAAVIVIVLNFLVCSIGLQKGVERVTKFMMIALFILLLGLGVYCCTLDGAAEGLKFYLIPSADSIKEYGLGTVISAAMSQAFFTLSIGIGSIAIFGSYIGRDRSLMGESVTIIGLDTFVALMSGLIIFPAYFTFNPGASGISADDAGAGFLFITFSNIFNNMPGGRIIGTLFFLFMIFAAFSTVIAVFENIISFWLELTKLNRRTVSLINIVLIIVLAIPAMLSENLLADPISAIFGKTMIDCEDFLVTNLALPIGSLFYVLFCTTKYGWGWDKFFEEMNAGKGLKLPKWMKPYMSYVLPVIILVVLVLSVI